MGDVKSWSKPNELRQYTRGCEQLSYGSLDQLKIFRVVQVIQITSIEEPLSEVRSISSV